ncbi:hypothetical protein [Nocardioides alkalitolerans]|uniref:hypothetical protein n=1 Tax=Nocardioides alkalitolerans TaxID=281714 RepID=UPI00040E814D|nr:hypothetical protein [Nocardioides alkalitolerans]
MKKLLVAVISAVVMAAGLVAGAGASPVAAAEGGYPGQYAVGSSIKVDAPWRFGRVGTGQGIAVFFQGSNNGIGTEVTGTTYVTLRLAGQGQFTATAYSYGGSVTRVVTPVIPRKGSYQVSITFVPSDTTYRSTTRSYWIWATPSGRP